MNKYEVIARVLNKLKYGTGEWIGFTNDLCNRIHDGAHNYVEVSINDVLPVVLDR